MSFLASVGRALVPAFLVLSLAAPALAQQDRDRVAFGGDARVLPGEVVQSVAAFGGTAYVDGEVIGDVAAFGGDVRLGPNARVHGSVSALGGRVDTAPGARFEAAAQPIPPMVPMEVYGAHCEIGGMHDHHEESFFGMVMQHMVGAALLFLLGLLLRGLTPERLSSLQVAMIRAPMHSAVYGLAGYVGSTIGIVLLAITIVGIPIAILVAMAMPVVTYVGLAAAATVIGAALPMERLRGEPVKQLAAGVAVLFVVSLVPFFGTLTLFAAACVGAGALLVTRFRPTPPTDLAGGAGPYRTAAD